MYNPKFSFLPIKKQILFSKEKSKSDIGVVVPAHNPGEIFESVLHSLDINISRHYKLVVIDDCSSKIESNNIRKVLENLVKGSSKLDLLVLYVSKTNLFETKSDNLGIETLMDCKYILEIQSDIVINEKNFDIKCLKAFDKYPDIFAISGRGCSNLDKDYRPRNPVIESLKYFFLKNKNHLFLSHEEIFDDATPHRSTDFYTVDSFGKIGLRIELEDVILKETPNVIYLMETIMRGPIFFRTESLLHFGLLNQRSHRLGNDDHELCLRLWNKTKMRSGYIPIGFTSELKWGASRKHKSLRDKLSYFIIKTIIYRNRKKSELWHLNDKRFVLPSKETRYLND